MMRRRKNKVSKMRGGSTHGYGSKKKHRGAGSRGGRGMAGSGKRADQRKPSINPSTYFGKHGFASVMGRSVNVICVGDIESRVVKLTERKIAVNEGGFICVDLNKMNVQKLLSGGNVKLKFKIKVDKASKKAIEKIEKAGGKVESEVSEEEFVPAKESE